MGYVYGPVYSKRLGFSLGIDIVPRKTCSFECVYCQLGRTSYKRIRRFKWVKINKFKKELKKVLKNNLRIDYITISGSGEPTLHKNLDVIIKEIKKISLYKIPVCVITNSSLLYRYCVRKELSNADVVMPSLDAPSPEIFNKINCPHKSISFKYIVRGLIEFRREFKGKIFLEIMLLKGYNDKKEYAYLFRDIIEKIDPDKVYLIFPYRPTPLSNINLIPSYRRIIYFKKILGSRCEIVGQGRKNISVKKRKINKEDIYMSLLRRPQTKEELKIALGCSDRILQDIIRELLREKKIYCVYEGKKIYYTKISY